MGRYDVLVGINLLREGLDLPEVSLVSILDADKEGFLRSGTSLIQTIGRAARNVSGQVHMYADTITDSMGKAIEETNRRRDIQIAYNKDNGIDPTPLRKRIGDITEMLAREEADTAETLERAKGSSAGARTHAKAPSPMAGRPSEEPTQAHRGSQCADARGRGRVALRDRRAAARRDRRTQEGTAPDARRGVMRASTVIHEEEALSPMSSFRIAR
ncbi:hypothetical protein GCM10025876_36850 [Demequina litorisediminis]|uniref:Helicase C-terminal domain-containing protein n=1 Tax=Demequina litorisediminis TaxID=1849022 RepID=A0ABQ6IIE9_9MICO|nr:hypothetical protein GCM10025876_36850 [Demequina litorisediminis]